ncbi:MAG: DUF3373 family protein [Planctomycetes bacterium]|nr:DUF3373 family protein [Planctomycetota bacterium]
MGNKFWKTCLGGVAAAVFCFAATPFVHGADSTSLEDMEKELNALRASVSSLTEQIETVKQSQTVSSAPLSEGEKGELETLRNEVNFLKEEFQTAAQAEQLKAQDITGNVYSEFAKKVKLGAQIRTRYEYTNGFYNTPDHTTQFESFGTRRALSGSSADDDYVLNQSRLWADGDVNEHLRIFIQIQDARSWGTEGDTVGFVNDGENSIADSANNRLDLHQGYFDIRNLFDLPLTVRVGRQEIVWGDHRVIGNFVWSNIGRTFDAARFMYDTDTYYWEAFGAKIDENGYVDGATDDDNEDENLYASMFTFKKLIPRAVLELMYIQKNDQDDDSNSAVTDGYDAGEGDSDHVVVHDLGFRLDGKALNLDAIDYTLESHFQVGDYGDQSHKAWALAARTGYTFKNVAWTPRIGVEYDFASGDDDVSDGQHETFDNLYPTNHWQGNYGFIDLVSWRNIHDYRANVKVNPTKKLMIQADVHYFELDEEDDGWYYASGNLASARSATEAEFSNTDDELAWEFDLTVSYSLYQNVGILAGYSFFKGEDWIDDVFGDEIESNWMYIQTTVTF